MNTDTMTLFPTAERIYKACMHTHTTLSDGCLTPQEIKEAYQARGYQIVAYTDHEACVAHPELRSEDFLPITAYEMGINDNNPNWLDVKCYHLNLYARDPENTAHVCFDPSYLRAHWPACNTDLKPWSTESRVYSVDYVNHVVEEANRAGYFVSYNHPCWSLQSREDYIGLKGIWGMELYNTTSVAEGYDDNHSGVYEDMLRSGSRLFPLATDDAHDLGGAFGGWIMVSAPSLQYGEIIDALEHGDFYATCGPQLHSLTLEKGELRIACSGCRSIRVITEHRHAFAKSAQNGELLTEVSFNLSKWYDAERKNGYFRVTLEDAEGKCAYTRAYTMDEVRAQFE